MKKLIGWPLSHAGYYFGHWAYLWLDSMSDADSEEPGRFWLFLWRCYQGGMAVSVKANDWAGLTIWKRREADSASEVSK